MIALLAATILATAPALDSARAERSQRLWQLTDSSEPPAQSYAGWTREQLIEERVRLEILRPGLGLPIGIIAAGGGLIVVDAVILLFGAFFALLGATFSPASIGVIIALAVFGGIGIGVGVYFLLPILKERSAIGAQMDEVDALLEQHPTAPPPQPVLQPPLQIQLQAPAPRLLIARF